MKLLICTQSVDQNDPVLGFFHRWIEEFAQHCESVHVLALHVGAHTLPNNVFIHSLGKNEGKGRFTYIFRFYYRAWLLRREYDSVFVHMNQVYVLLGWPLWKVYSKRIGLWYMHKSVTATLRTAEKMVNFIFTASSESFRLPSKKLKITGHGIDTNHFEFQTNNSKDLDLITVGRISPAKNLELLINVLAHLHQKGKTVSLTIIGKPSTELDADYFEKIKQLALGNEVEKYIKWLGAIPNTVLPTYLGRAKVFIHAATNGSLDKALLEPLAVGVPVVSTAEGASSLPLGKWNVTEDAQKFADQVSLVLEFDNSKKIADLRKFVEERHSLSALIPKILKIYQHGL